MLILTACGKRISNDIFENGKPLVVVYGDYKCPYCKELDEKSCQSCVKLYR